MRIVVLIKPVPDPAAAAERLRPDGRLDRAAAPTVANGNDEYALEAALQLVDAHGGEVTLLAMAPETAPETLRKALAMGAHRAVLVTDPELGGSCTLSTTKVLAAALSGIEADLVFAGADTSDGRAGVVPAGIAALRRIPLLSSAAKVEAFPDAGRVRVHRLAAAGYDVLEAPMPALIVATQALGAPRYPSLKGIMAARSKEVRVVSAADLGFAQGSVGGAAATTKLLETRTPPSRGATRVIRETPAEAARLVVEALVARGIVR